MLEVLETIRPAFTQPTFVNLMVVFGGWTLTPGRHAITESLVRTDVSGFFHHQAFHRVFSRARWCADEVGRLVFLAAKALTGQLQIAIDDTVTSGKGPGVFGLGCHLDASRSTRRFKVFTFGHCWVTLALVVPVPFSNRPWALPILFRLYRNKSECKKAGVKHHTKNALARELLDLFLTWVPQDQRVILCADSAYCCKKVLRGQSFDRLVVLGSMAINVALYACAPAKPTGKKGRPRTRGDRLPSLTAWAADNTGNRAWQPCTASVYQETKTLRSKTLDACWHAVLGTHLLRVVLVECAGGGLPFRTYFSTDPTLPVQQILEGYSRRWSIEVCFRDLKQYFGFGDSSARSQKAVLRTTPFVGLAFSLLVIWFAKSPAVRKALVLPLRPWYLHKHGFSFLDIVRAAQSDLRHVDFRAEVAKRRLPSKICGRHQRRPAPPAVHRAQSAA